MANKVTLKRSSVAGKIPQITDLDYGEVALNFTDGRLYFRNSNDQIEYFETPGEQNVFRILANDLNLGLVTGPSTQTLDLGSVTDAANEEYDLEFVYVEGLIFPETLVLRSYTVANLPDSNISGQLAFVTDEVSGPTVAFFDGTNWRRVTDNNVVSNT